MGRHLGVDFKSILMDFGTQLGIPNGPKIDPKSIKKRFQHGKASWHRFLSDFVGFGVPSWNRNSAGTDNAF